MACNCKSKMRQRTLKRGGYSIKQTTVDSPQNPNTAQYRKLIGQRGYRKIGSRRLIINPSKNR